jgi:dihydroorotate dehydrogenase (NAD+) catalytic subunit
MADLTVELLGSTLRNPVMNASGTLGYGKEIEPLWKVDVLGAYVTKGLSLLPHHGNPPPRLWEERSALINAIGLQNVGVERFFADYFPLFKKRKTPIIVNFFGFSDEEYVRCAERIEPDPFIAALEINLSCPNIKKGGICLGKEAQGVFGIISRVKQVTPIPLIAKLTPEVSDIVEIARAASEAGADGVTVLNTMPASAIDLKTGRLAIRGGLSGPPLKPMALKAVTDISQALSFPVIGAGGIMNASDVVEFLVAGATAVQVGTASLVDPLAIPHIIEGLHHHLDSKDISRVRHLIGAARAR